MPGTTVDAEPMRQESAGQADLPAARNADERGFVDAAIKRPRAIETLLREVRDPHMASLFYAASLAAVDKHDEVNRAYLAYLAARLKLPPEVLTRLHSQFGFAPAG